jgi:N-terminal glutamine amidase
MQSDDGTNLTLQMSLGDNHNSNSAAIPARCTTELSTAAMTALSQNVQSDHDLRVACYCEENVWRIAYRKLHYPTQHEQLRLAESSEQHNNNTNGTTTAKYVVAFISNKRQCVPMLHQRASSSPSEVPCCWDYHVILLGVHNSQRDVGTTETKDTNNCVLVYDVDTTLQPYPISLAEYLMATFPNVEEEYPYPEYRPRFRLISAPLFVQYFASDRRHMYNTTTQSWNAPPPTYACIVPPPCCSSSCSSSTNTSDPTITNTHKTTDSIHGNNHEHNEPTHGIGVGPNNAWNSNLKYYLDFQETMVEHQQDFPHDALGSIVTLQQLREYRF